MASPSDSSGIGMTAMLAAPVASSARRCENRLAAASTTSPAGERLRVVRASAPGGSVGPNASSASPGFHSHRVEAQAARAARSARRAARARAAHRRPGSDSHAAALGERCAQHLLDARARQRRPGAAASVRRGTPRSSTPRPLRVAPPSSTMSMRPSRSAMTCCAVVGETWPERLADGATIGLPNAASSARATGWSGTRTAIVSRPAVARSATGQPGACGSTSVSGPGHSAASRSAAASNRASLRAPARSATCEISGLKRGRPWRHRAARPPLRWWHRRRARTRSRSGNATRPPSARQRAAAATAARSAVSTLVL